MDDEKTKPVIGYFWQDEPKPDYSHNPKVKLICADKIKPEAISWLWKGYLARGKFHIFAGAAGTGKTTLAIKLAACVSRGLPFPDGTQCEPASVLIWSGEDDIKDTLLPRLIASGANMCNIHFVSSVLHHNQTRSFDPAKDMQILYETVTEMNICKLGLLIVDPVVNAVAGDSHKNGEVRRALAPLVDFGIVMGCAILGITHFSKGTSGREPMERVTGSLAFAALARIVLATAKITVDGDCKRIFCRAKSNIGQDGDGFEYAIVETELDSHKGVFTSFANFGAAVNGSAIELLSEQNTSEGNADDCVEFLSALLKGHKLTAKEVFEKTRENGFNDKQVRAASREINVHIRREGFGKGSAVYWSMVDINMDSILSQTLPKN